MKILKTHFRKNDLFYALICRNDKVVMYKIRQENDMVRCHYEVFRIYIRQAHTAFDVEFEDGLSFLEPHATIRKANRISAKATPVSVEVDDDLGSHFKVTYDNGQVAEVSWSFIRELPPKK